MTNLLESGSLSPARRRTASVLLAVALFGLVLGGTQRRGSAVDGDGTHTGPTTQETEFGPTGPKASPGDGKPNTDPTHTEDPCAKQNSNYTGAGLVNVTQGRVTYSGPITFKYFYVYQWGGPFGSFKPIAGPDADNPKKACLVSNRGAHPVDTASMEGDNGSYTIKCQWTKAVGATYLREFETQERVVFPGGSGTPTPGADGTCTIQPDDGPARTTNTEVVLEGTLDPREGASGGCPPTPAPVTCTHVYTLKATTVGLVPPEPPPVPSVVAPASLTQGSANQVVKLTGKEFDKNATLAFGPGVAVNSTAYESITTLTANVSVASDAAIGPRDVTVTNADGVSGVCAGCFQVTQGVHSGGPPPPPPPPPPGPGGDPPFQGPGNTTPAGGKGSGPGPAARTPAEPPPPAQISSSAGASAPVASSSQPITPAPPGGTGGPPVMVTSGAFAPTTAGAGAPVGMAAEIQEEALQSAPEAGARALMVGRMIEGQLPEVLFMSFGMMMLIGCFTQARRVRWPVAPEEDYEPAAAWAGAKVR